MEKEGFDRSMAYLDREKLQIEALVTDRHPSIVKVMKEKYGNKKKYDDPEGHPSIRHYYDCWHVAKGIVLIQIRHVDIYFALKKMYVFPKEKRELNMFQNHIYFV